MEQDCNEKTLLVNQETERMFPGAGRKHSGAKQGRRGPKAKEKHLAWSVMVAAIQLQSTVAA